MNLQNLLFLLLLFSFSSTAQIQFLDLKLEDLNIQHITKIQLSFSIETTISKTDYLKILFPEALHSSVNTDNIVTQIKGQYWKRVDSGTLVKYSIKVCGIVTFFILRVDLQYRPEFGRNFLAILANTGYDLEFIFETSLTLFSKAPLQLWTVSSMDASQMIYDYNNVFGYLDYTSSPSQTLQLSYYINEENSFQIGLSYTLNVQIEPTSAWQENMKIKMKFSNNDFTITGSVCNSIAGEGPYIPALTKGEYTCEIASAAQTNTQFFQNYVEILIKKAITANTRLTFSFTVKNPYIITSSNLEVTLAQASNNNIVEYNELQNIVETLPLSWNYGTIYLAWGVGMSQTDLPPALRPIRTSLAGTQRLYNSFKFTFSTDYDTQTFLPIMIELSYKDDGGTVTLLPGSITENLPNCEGGQVRCVNDDTNQKLQCKNICGLQKDEEYYIGIKVSLVYSASAPALNQNFGKLIAYPIKNPVTETYDSVALFESIQSSLILETANSEDWHNNDIAYGYSNVHTHTTFGTGVTDLASSQIKIQAAQQQAINFLIKTQATDFYTGVPPAPTTNLNAPSAGIEVVSSSIFQIPTGTSSFHYYSLATITNASHVTVTQISTDDSQNKKFTKYRFGVYHWQELGEILVGDGSTYIQLGIGPIIIDSYSSHYADQLCFDFYGVTVEKSLTNTNQIAGSTVRKYFLFNSYALNKATTPLSNLYAHMSIYETYSSGTMDGSAFPAVLRIFGYLSDAEKIITKRIVIFFDNLQPFYSETEEQGNGNEVGCGGSLSKIKCYGYNAYNPTDTKLNSVHLMRRVEIDVSTSIGQTSSSLPFQIIIPFKTTSTNTVDLILGTLAQSSYVLSSKPYYQLNNIKEITTNTGTSQAALALHADFSAPNFVIQVTTNSLVGVKQTTAITLNLQVTIGGASGINGNAGASQGAGFIWNSKWNFTNSALSMNSAVVATTEDKQCEYYWYCVDRACTDKRFGIFCPLSQTLTSAQLYTISLYNMQFPSINNLPGDMYSAISDNDGSYKAYQTDAGGSLLQANVMTVGNLTSNITKNLHSQNNSFEFTSTNEIPINGYLQFSSSNNLGFECSSSEFCWIAKSANDQESDSIKCDFSCNGNSGLRFIVKSTLVAGSWKIHFYGLSASTPTNDINQFSLRSYSSSGQIIDSTTTQGVAQFGTQSLTPSISFGKYYIDFLYLNSYATVQLDFKIVNKTYLYRNEYFKFQLLPLFNQAIQSSIMCRILQNGIQLQTFKKCEIDNSIIKLYPKTDIKLNSNTEFSLFLENVLIFSSSNPIGNITFSLQSLTYTTDAILSLTQAQQINIASIPELPLQLYDPGQNLSAFYKQPLNYVSLPTDYTFTYTTNQTISASTRIILKFPQYYLPRLSTSLILCKINDKYTTHSFLSPRVLALQFKTLNYEIEKNKPFNITIDKITQPYLNSTTDLKKIMIGVSQENETFAEAFWYSDTPLQSSLSKVSSCSLHNVTYSSYYIRSYSTLTLTFQFTEISLNYQFNMTIFLNSLFETQLKYAIPRCHLVLRADNYSTQLDCDNSYTTIEIYNIFFPDNITSDIFEIELTGVPTPFYEINEKEYLIIFHYYSNTTNEQTIAYWTSTIKRNYDLLAFTPNPDLVSLELYKQDENNEDQYKLVDGSTTKYEFEILPGFFSSKFKIKAGNILNGSNLEFFHDDQNRLITNPSTLLLKVGMKEIEFTLGYSFDESQGAVETQFFKTGLGVLDIFQELGRIKLILLPPETKLIAMNNYEGNYVIPVGGYSVPIFINISDTVPVEQFSVICNVTQGSNLGNYLEFYGTTDMNKSQIIMQFNQNQMFGIILIHSLSYSSYEKSTQVDCYIQGENQKIFSLSHSSFTVTTLSFAQEQESFKTVDPSLTINSVDNSFSTKIVFQFDVDQDNVLVWWHLCYNNSMPVYSRDEIARKLPGFKYSHEDPYQNQIGIIYNKKGYDYQTLEINNLLANYTYKIVFLIENQYGRQNEAKYTFLTLDNDASLFRLRLAFNGNLTSAQMKSICCFNQIYLQILLSDYTFPQFVAGPNAINCWSDLSIQEEVIEEINATSSTTNTTMNKTIKATSYSNLQTVDSYYPIFYITPNITYEIFIVDAYNYTYQDLYGEFDSTSYYEKLYEYIPSLPDSLYTQNILTEFVQISRLSPNIIFHFSNSSWVENQKLTNFTIDAATPFGYLFLVLTNYSTEVANQTEASENQLKGKVCTESSNLFNFVEIRKRISGKEHYKEYTNNGQYYFYTAHIFLNQTNSQKETLDFSYLAKNQTYSLYYFVTSENPTMNSQTSDLFKLTLRIEEIKAVFADKMMQTCFFGLTLLMLLLLGLLI